MSIYNPQRPLPVKDPEQAFELYCKLDSPALSVHAFRNEQKRNFRHNAVCLLTRTKIAKENNDINISSLYTAMHYLDRFISAINKPPILKNNDNDYFCQITTICCLGLAYKMIIGNKFTYKQLLGDNRKLGIHQNDILKVEGLIIRANKYRMRSITALCFAPYFLSLFADLPSGSRPHVKEIIIQLQASIGFTQYSPSIIAAAAVLTSYKNDPTSKQRLAEGGRITLDQGLLRDCAKKMLDMCMKKIVIQNWAFRFETETKKMEMRYPILPWKIYKKARYLPVDASKFADKPEDKIREDEPRPEPEDGIIADEPRPEPEDKPEAEDKIIADEPRPEAGDGILAVEPIPEAEGIIADKPTPEAEDGIIADEPRPEAEDGTKADEPRPKAEDGTKADEPRPEAEDGTKTDKPRLEAEDGIIADEPRPEAEHSIKADKPRPEAEDGIIADEPRPEAADNIIADDSRPKPEARIIADEPRPKPEDETIADEPEDSKRKLKSTLKKMVCCGNLKLM